MISVTEFGKYPRFELKECQVNSLENQSEWSKNWFFKVEREGELLLYPRPTRISTDRGLDHVKDSPSSTQYYIPRMACANGGNLSTWVI